MTQPDDAPNTLNQAWADAFNAGDLPRLMRMYEQDAVLIPGPGASPLRGHAAIKSALKAFLALGGSLSFTPRHWLTCGDVAMGGIAFVMHGGHDADGNPIDLAGTTAEVARRQPDGSWKYLIDHPFGGADD